MAIINGVGRVGIRNYVSPISTSVSSYLLDTYGDASTALSFRKISSTATLCVRVRESGGNTEQDFGFSGDNVDEAAILSFCGSNSGHVVKWYDQSGNGRDMIQAISTKQPKIVNAVVLNKQNGKASMLYDGSDDFLYSTYSFSQATPLQCIIIAKNTKTADSYPYFMDSTVNRAVFYYGGAYLSLYNGGQIDSTSTPYDFSLFNVLFNSYQSNIRRNGVSLITGNDGNSGLSGQIFLGARVLNGGTQTMTGNMSEYILYPSNNSSNNSPIETNINTYYGIYPTYTTRTTAFAAATGITDTTILNALNTFDTGLISNGLDTKMKALYPMVGGTANTHKFNFMDAQDTDTAFRLAFNGGWVHSSTGALPNGINAFADAKLNLNTMNSINDISYGYYCRTNSISLGSFGWGKVPDKYLSNEFWIRYNDDNKYGYIFDSANDGGSAGGDCRGFNAQSRIASNVKYIQKNSLISTYTSLSTGSLFSRNFIFSQGSQGYENRENAFGYISNGLTNTELSNLYTLTQALQTSLSRQV